MGLAIKKKILIVNYLGKKTKSGKVSCICQVPSPGRVQQEAQETDPLLGVAGERVGRERQREREGEGVCVCVWGRERLFSSPWRAGICKCVGKNGV